MKKIIKDISIGYITGFNFGGWSIPHKIQTTIIHTFANNNKKEISYCIHEYLDSKNNSLLFSGVNENSKIENIFFVSALQLNKNNQTFFETINKYNLFFFLENKVFKKKESLKDLKDHIYQISSRKSDNFRRSNYQQLFNEYKKFFR